MYNEYGSPGGNHDDDDDDYEYDDSDGYDDGYDDGDDYDDYDTGTVRIECDGLADPALAVPVVNRFIALSGVLNVEPDLANRMVEIEIDLTVTSADEIWAAIQGDPTIQPKRIH